MTEADLIQGCLANKRIAQRELYEKYKKAMFTLAYRLCGDFDEAADVLQESFIDIFKGLDSFKNQSTLGAWMKTIVSRKAIARFRNKVFFDQLDSVAEQKQVVWESDLDIELLEKGIMALPEGYRSVIILYEIEGYKHHEIAGLLGITEGTSKSQLYHAKRKLKEWIEKCKINSDTY
jgi:RNA polymerase sigma factor (sigma-70 family)